MEIRPIHRILAALIYNNKKSIEDMPDSDKEAVQYVLDTEYKNEDEEDVPESEI